ncbi:dihydrofolate reductase [Rhodocytophaga rosea]|uniref:Dihydrofolate reductase n=1 Tax=Rhodocytophaga rosea TaxID=2704465 RepID=A0A6C0GS98_9BACT|nr:dihydrofolate reductase family protein [Rhodocytophaga rosea]QHT70936.1 dihydrofolate reductase [Rhodocytophaga rosea]
MRKVKLYIATSLDGKIARKDGSVNWLPDPASEDYGYQPFDDSIDATLMGYKTYEICLQFGEWPYQGKSTYVFTRDSAKPVVPESILVTQNPVDFVRHLKEQKGKDIWLVGGGEIVSLFHDADLIDEYILAFIPVLLGEGIELFPNIKKQENLRLIRHNVFSNGAVLLYLEKG